MNLSKEKMHVDNRMFLRDDDVITITLQFYVIIIRVLLFM